MPISFPYRIDRTGRTASPEDEAAHVRELIEQVLFTTPGERVNRPSLGTGVYQLLFSPASNETAAAVQQLVRSALQNWLARWIEITDVSVRAEAGVVEIVISYILRRTRESQEARFTRAV